ncbi:MAG: DUF4175 family protein [Bacteroidota bacterium]
MEEDNILISKLNEFTRKYYKNRIIRGALISLAVLVALFLLEILLEYFSYFPSLARIILVYFYISTAVILLGVLVLRPLLKFLRVGKILSREQAASMIGDHFSEIRDKLLNTLQLMDQKGELPGNIDLIIASIDQRIRKLKPVPFTAVINLRKNLRYLKYALPPLFILFLLLLISPGIVSDPALRLIKYNSRFSPPALFRLVILNKELKAMQQDDFTLRVEVKGDEIPDEVLLKTGGSTFTMKRENLVYYTFSFKSLQSDTRFTMVADDKETEEYTISVYPKPIILNFEARCDYPEYTGKPTETLNNIGDFIIPEGTLITWNIYTRDVSAVKFKMPSEEINLEKKASNVFSCSKRVFESVAYSIFQENSYIRKSDSLKYSITVIKDAFPEISLKETRDSASTSKLFLQGTIKDDYGFTKLVFYLMGKGQPDSVFSLKKTENLKIDKNSPSQVYYYALELADIEIKPGDKYSYYFEIWDNDGIRGPKSAKTMPMTFEIPSLEQMAETTEKNEENLKRELNQSIRESKDISKSLEEINKRMVDQNDVSWKEKRKLEEVLKANERIQKQVSDFKKKNEENIRNENEYLKTSERIVEKQRKLNDLTNQLLTEEMKKTMKEMKDLLNQMDKEKLSNLLPRMKQMNVELEKELDRNLQLFKQIEFERKLEQNSSDLKALSEEQKKMAERTREQKKSSAELADGQKEIQKKFDTISKKFDELDKQGKEMENAPDLMSTETDRQEISKQLDANEQLMKSGKMDDASKSQKKTSQEMKELADKIDQMQESSEEESQEEDAEALKLLLQNLNQLSFQQEELLLRTSFINRNDPKYLQLIEDQKAIRDKFKNLEDTLNKISRREVMLKSIIIKEVSMVKENLSFSEVSLGERLLPDAMARQQYAMTGINDLSLLLDEVLKQMDAQVDNMKMKAGTKACKKPSKQGGKKSLNSMRQVQQEMKSRLEKMKQSLNNAKKGKQGSRGEEESLNKEIGQMVAQQEAIRQALQDYENGLKESGSKGDELLNSVIEDLEKNEQDILNRRISQETFNRQEKIVTRMLESEKAEQQREKQEQREATEAKTRAISNPNANLEYKRSKSGGKDVINFAPAPVNYYYKTKASEYFLKIGN